MLYKFCYLFILFLIYSIFGWITETICCCINQKKLVLNRGFLIGPYCPVYGTAAIIVIIFLTEYKSDLFTFYAMTVVYASIIEYLTSYLMEKIFKARWWDYTNHKCNLNGRICLTNCLLFGLLGIIVMYGINPFLVSIIDMIPKDIFTLLTLIIMAIFLLDVITTNVVVSKIKLNIQNIRTDSTEEMDKAIKEALSHHRISYKRLLNTFPKVRFNFDTNNVITKSLKKRLEELDTNLHNKKMEIKNIKDKIRNMKDNNVKKEEIEIVKEELKTKRRKKVD